MQGYDIPSSLIKTAESNVTSKLVFTNNDTVNNNDAMPNCSVDAPYDKSYDVLTNLVILASRYIPNGI
jgi:hypothetical protein